MKKNMKIEINKNQPLDEVVKELERLGFKRDCWWSYVAGVKTIEACGETMHLMDYVNHDISVRLGELTTLPELKEMK